MKTLQSFKKEKVELKSVNGGRMLKSCPTSGWLIWEKPGGAETEGNTQSWVHPDYN